MQKGRNAAKAFAATRGVRFADSRRRTAEQKAAEVAAGTRRAVQVVAVADVRDDDEVAVKGGGFAEAGATDRDQWDSADGMTFVRRFGA